MDKTFSIYNISHVHLNGEIRNGKLHIISEVYGDDYDSEKHYELSKEETNRLFSLISLEDFIDYCRKNHVSGMEDLFNSYNITYYSRGI